MLNEAFFWRPQAREECNSHIHYIYYLLKSKIIQLLMFYIISIVPLLAILVYYILLPYIKFIAAKTKVPSKNPILSYLPVIGQANFNYFIQKKDYYKYYRQFNQNYPDADYMLSNFLWGPCYILMSPKMIESYYKSGGLPKSKTLQLMKKSYGQSIFVSQNQRHAKKRRLLSKVFNFDFISKMSPNIYKIFRQELLKLKGDQFIQVRSRLQKITSKIVLQSFIGFQSQSIILNGTPLHEQIIKSFDLISNASFQLSYLFFGKYSDQLKDLTNQIKHVIRQEIVKKIRKGGSSPCIINQFVRQYNKDLTQQEQIEQLLQQLIFFIFAGTDTTATLLQHLMFRLGTQDNLVEKLQSQLQTLDYNKIDKSFATDLPYLNAIIKEEQRIHGPASLYAPREALQDLLLQDLIIPKGSLVFLDLNFTHLNEKYYKEPFKFDVDRWINKDMSNSNFYQFLPFSAGAKNCIGQHLALTEVRLFLSCFKDLKVKLKKSQKGEVIRKLAFITTKEALQLRLE